MTIVTRCVVTMVAKVAQERCSATGLNDVLLEKGPPELLSR